MGARQRVRSKEEGMDYVCFAGTACVACVGPDGARHTLGNGHLEVLGMMKMMPLVDDDRKMEYDPLLIGEYISL
jgi:hypothetical protein